MNISSQIKVSVQYRFKHLSFFLLGSKIKGKEILYMSLI